MEKSHTAPTLHNGICGPTHILLDYREQYTLLFINTGGMKDDNVKLTLTLESLDYLFTPIKL